MAFPQMQTKGAFGDQFVETTGRQMFHGSVMTLPDGRRFVYASFGAATVAGSLYQSEVRTANWFSENPTAVAAKGAIQVTMDVNTTPALDDFEDGNLVDETNFHCYTVKGNSAADPTVVDLYEKLQTDLITADVVSIMKSAYKDTVIKTAARADAPAIGIAPFAQTSTHYGWLQTYGISVALAEDVLIIGDRVVASPVSDAGAVSASITNLGLDQTVGRCLEIGTNQAACTIFLTLG